MKKIVILIAVFCLLPFTNVLASSGTINKDSIIECNGVFYGYHGSDKHYHKALLENGVYKASGKSLGTNFSCDTVMVSKIVKTTLNKCVDGDTAVFNINGEQVRARFLAIDTPESVHPTKEVELYGKDASEYTCKMLTNAQEIVLEYDNNSDEKDKYGRDLVWVFVDQELLQKKLVKVGYASVAYLYGDYKYTDDLYNDLEYAKTNKLGIWSEEKSTSEDDLDDSEINLTVKIAAIIITGIIIVYEAKKRLK